MKGSDFRVFSKHYDHIYLKRKDCGEEAKTVKEIIKQSKKGSSRTLLDVGCGTGEHLKYLSADFQCTGMDVNRDMIEIAEKKVSNVKFRVASMIDLKLKERFDVIVCLFSSIGYVQNFVNLVKTLRSFYRHLNSEGLVVVEPWIFKKDFKKGYIGIDTYENEKVKLARMATSRIEGSKWRVYMYYLIGEKGQIRYAEEIHEMLALDYSGYMKAFESNRFRIIKFIEENLWDGCRGLFIAVK